MRIFRQALPRSVTTILDLSGGAGRIAISIAFLFVSLASVATLAAGLATVITVNDYTRGHDFRDATIVLDQLGEPDAPCTVLSGPSLNGARCLGIEQLRLLSAQANRR